MDHPELTAQMRLKSENDGKVVLFAEKQSEILRQREKEMRNRITEIHDRARNNELLFDKSRQLILDLIESDNLTEIMDYLHGNLRHGFNTDTSSLILFGNETDDSGVGRIVPLAEARKVIPAILRNSEPTCGILRDFELEFLFPANREVASAIAAPLLRNERVFGVLAIGSYDPERFRKSMGTLFLSYIIEVLSRLIPRYYDID